MAAPLEKAQGCTGRDLIPHPLCPFSLRFFLFTSNKAGAHTRCLEKRGGEYRGGAATSSPLSSAFYLGPTISAIKHFPDLSPPRSTHRWLLEQRVINESALVKLPRPSFVLLRFLPSIPENRFFEPFDREVIARNLFSLRGEDFLVGRREYQILRRIVVKRFHQNARKRDFLKKSKKKEEKKRALQRINVAT